MPEQISVGARQYGVLPSATPVVIDAINQAYPITVTLKSSDANRKIEISVDGGTEYFTPVPAVTSSTMLALSLMTPVSHIRVTGVTSDTWSIR